MTAQLVFVVVAVLFFNHVTMATDLICRLGEPCSVSYKTLGCYKDYGNDRVLPNYIYNERDSSHRSYGGRRIEWYNWEHYMAGFSCRCAKKAQELGYDLFGVQFYGECWAGNSNAHSSRLTKTNARCVGDGYKACGASSRYCTGEQFSNFVYQIVDTSCSINFVKEGCYRDSHIADERPLANYVLNDRDSTDSSYSGRDIDWTNWDVYLPELACRCAQKAKENGSLYFGLQYYGECWTHPQGADTYGKDGASSECVDTCYKPCKQHPFCAGVQFSNYVYRIKEQEGCDANLQPIGCYTENPSSRVLAVELVNAKYPPSDEFYGEMVDPEDWSNFFPGFLCKCAHEAKIKGYAYFGVSDNGVCYSSPVSENYNQLGASSSCYEGKPSRSCGDGSVACAGYSAEANYVYKIVTES